MTRAAVLLLALLAAGCSSSRFDDAAYIKNSGDFSVPEGVERRFTICHDPLSDKESTREAIDRLVFAQCGRYVEPRSERAAACTLFHPSQKTFTCLLPPE
ncbi:hypothetical protein [Azospirillum sp.]|uniref:hypothetical protein n=1 Tax=Azospirillum sp. TaxID=34012 RepID=UPI002D646A43|nr:hypothetical protein [Azospirillum sp.]HYD64557.1 hypothetical protein [Azospirillum sp.]